MKLTDHDIDKLANLARIELVPEEKKRFADQLSFILDYMTHLNEVDTSQVEASANVPPSGDFRHDDVEAWPDNKPIVGQWPKRAGNLNKVKPVLE
jgi:aspartyl-tRNA(Asn)/glutamyl-tRNA(Gln) amidotransferase subunit C